jgi:hypothetical protein
LLSIMLSDWCLNEGMPSRTPTDQLPIPMCQDNFAQLVKLDVTAWAF